MIFNKDYDMSLWYIINSTKRYNKSLTNFMVELSSEFINKVRQAIKESSQNYSNCNNISSGVVELNKKEILYFLLNADNQMLTLSKSIFNGKNYSLVFELNLNPFILEEMEINNYLIGSITNYLFNRIDNEEDDEKNYKFYSLKRGGLVISQREQLGGSMTYIFGKYYNFENVVDEEIEVSNLLKRRL